MKMIQNSYSARLAITVTIISYLCIYDRAVCTIHALLQIILSISNSYIKKVPIEVFVQPPKPSMPPTPCVNLLTAQLSDPDVPPGTSYSPDVTIHHPLHLPLTTRRHTFNKLPTPRTLTTDSSPSPCVPSCSTGGHS